MPIFLVRHAHALDGADDDVRPLSAKGRAQVKRVAKFLRAAGGFTPDEIWHSPLLRAHETAELLVRGLRSAAPRRVVTGLRPEDNPRLIARRLANTRRVVALVGHEPHLSALASLLVAGADEPPVFEMKKCGVLALEQITARWMVRWHLSPELLA